MTSPTIDTLTTRLLQILGDGAANRFTADITDEAFRLALSEYSYAVPDHKCKLFTVTSAGREQALPLAGAGIDHFTGLISITQVLFPYEGDDQDIEQTPHSQYYFYWTAGAPVLYIGGSKIPAVDDEILVTYAATHTIDDLDSAAACTVPTHDFELILQGAAGHAARLRTAIYNESFSAHPELKLFAIDALKFFRDSLRSRTRKFGANALPPKGFKLDQWDGSS